MTAHLAQFALGQIVRHRMFPFRGVVFDVDPQFANSEEWYQSIPEPVRPRRDQPFYHLLAENDEGTYVAYVSEQNLQLDELRRAGRPPSDQRHVPGLQGRTLSAEAPQRQYERSWAVES